MYDERLDPTGEGGDAMYHAHRDKLGERRPPICSGCKQGFTATEAEFAVEQGGKRYHATCFGTRRKRGRLLSFRTQAPE